MNLFNECVAFLNREKDNAHELTGVYNLGTMKTTGWKVYLKITAEKHGNERDVVSYPFVIVNAFKNGKPTTTPECALELDDSFQYIFWEISERNKFVFAHVLNKMKDDDILNRISFVERCTMGANSIDALTNYASYRGYNFQEIVEELQNDFDISIN